MIGFMNSLLLMNSMMNSCSMNQQSICISYILCQSFYCILDITLMTPMNKPELPPEAVHWTVFNESEALAVIMRAQNYINDELLRE